MGGLGWVLELKVVLDWYEFLVYVRFYEDMGSGVKLVRGRFLVECFRVLFLVSFFLVIL